MAFTDPDPSPLALLLLGQEADADTEKGVECPGALPDLAPEELVDDVIRLKSELGDEVFILGHHYQRDQVIRFADVTGDSFKLAQQAAARPDSPYIVFCGVHFMAESADILTSPEQKVVLPDLAAGCSMADMADIGQVETAWLNLTDLGVAEGTIPVTYMNSTAAIKAFTGRHGGLVCTSSNAQESLEWAFARGQRVLFLPDQHLGRNTAVRQLGMSLDDCVVYNPYKPNGGLTPAELKDAKMILWRGHCSVHAHFRAETVDEFRRTQPDAQVLVHPECKYDVVERADLVGSTEFIIKTINDAPAGSAWGIGTELNLVKRLAETHPDKQITFLDRSVCFCATMNRIDLPHLHWALTELAEGRIPNQITVSPEDTQWARVALDRMLTLVD